MAESVQHTEAGRRGYEENRVRLRGLIISGLCLALLAALSLLAMWLLFDYFSVRRARLEVAPHPLSEGQPLPPEPRLQVSPQQDLQTMRAAEETVLHSYGWVDQQAGIVRIPIARAIEVIAARGLPARSAGQQGASDGPQGAQVQDQDTAQGDGG